MKFVLWGFGLNGRRILQFVGDELVCGIIDSDKEKQGLLYGKIPVFSFQEYKNHFSEYCIVVTPLIFKDIENILRSEGIFSYFILEECPSEIKVPNKIRSVEEVPLAVTDETSICICGSSFYSFLLYHRLQMEKRLNLYLKWDDTMEDKRRIAIKKKLSQVQYWEDSKTVTIERLLLTTKLACEKVVNEYSAHYIEDLYHLNNLIPDYYNESIKKLRGAMKGKTCFIVGTGPSLRISDLDVLKKNKAICFSMNGIVMALGETEWRPDYYVVSDPKACEAYEKEIVQGNIKYKFISDMMPAFWEKERDEHYFKFHLTRETLIDGLPLFSDEIERQVYEGYTVTYSCLQIAFYMGFTKIYLLGIDFNYSADMKAPENHFISGYQKQGQQVGIWAKDETYGAYLSARQEAEKRNIKIYNATRGGKLEVFERVNFDGLF
ncbi:MAG: 6-hydroxymethylpterin diphosphokinase MptE-like protein [Enterocloster bolteae]|uniref:6-hydroxymethylpterin diphosphokinase MptE-like protein n=1 Tax=Enterocloster bolteae TaxID=208479 RepID=UPI003992974D